MGRVSNSCGRNAALLELKFIVLSISHTLTTRIGLRLVFAAFFALILLAEWGSHGVILSHHTDSNEGEVASSSEQGHDDPCKTMICSDGQRRDQGFKFSHESSQHNAYFGPLSRSKDRPQLETGRLSHSSLVVGISRPPDPAFHPPEIS